MGIVFRARDQRLERDVAIKILPRGTLSSDAARRRFRQEALTLSKISHANVAHIYDFDTQDGIDFLVMEFVRGVTLSQKLVRGPLPEESVVGLGRQVAEALAAASALGIVHRDLKPGNVMITPAGDAKLLDFGLARLIESEEVTRSSTNAAEPWTGTLYYMAPEQLKGEPSDFRSDIYQVGAVLYEAVTGTRPFEGTTAGALIHDILHKPVVPPHDGNPNISPGLEAIILCCLAKDPARRYQRASELRAALDAIVPTSSGSRPEPLASPQSVRWQLPVGVLILAVLFTGAALIWRRHQPPSQPLGPSRVSQLAVLPIADPGGDNEVTAFGNGLVHTLTSRLSQLGASHSLQVVPASDIREKHVSTLDQASQEFGATMGLELNVERHGEIIRVNYALVDASQHRQLNGDTITASFSDPFSLEDQVAESVVRSLQVELRPEERQALTEHGTSQPAAYDYYLQGRGYLEDFLKPENVENAITEFQRALQSDPNYSLAFSGLGEAYWRKYEQTKQPSFARQARSACDRAVESGPNQALAHLCLGVVDAGTGAYEKALGEYKTASDLEPTNDAAYNGLADVYGKLGKPTEAENTFRKAISLRPNYWATYNSLGAFYVEQGRYSEASQMFSQVIALVPDSFVGYSNLGVTYVYLGDYEKAIPALEQSVAIRPTAQATSNLGTAYFQLHKYAQAARTFEKATTLNAESYDVWGNLGDAYYWSSGERGKSKAAYQRAIDLALKAIAVNSRDASVLSYAAQYYAMSDQHNAALAHINQALRLGPGNSDLFFTAALVFNQCGDTEQALAYLEKAVSAGASKSTLRDTPNFDNLRDLPRFKRLLGP